MNDGLSRLYHVDEQREKKNHVSEIKVAIFQTSWVTVHFFLKSVWRLCRALPRTVGTGLKLHWDNNFN